MIITSTPLRISFIGAAADYPIWYREHGGSVSATTVDKCCSITCRRLPPFFEYHSRVSHSTAENVLNFGNLVLPCQYALHID
jgi:D-glycero-alpha-D-manno-heptose-7-phosphate kinase